MRFQVMSDKGTVIGFTDDYQTAQWFFEGGYLVTGWNYPAFVNSEGNR